MPSVKISDATYQRIKAVADAEQRTIAVTIDRLTQCADKQAVVDEYLGLTALNEVQRRWHRVKGNRPALPNEKGADITTHRGVRVDGR